MTERELALLREARAFEKLIRKDAHNRRPAHGKDMQQLKRRRNRRSSNRKLWRLVQVWHSGA